MLFSFPKIDHPVIHFHDHVAYFFRQVFKNELAEFNIEILIHSNFRKIVNDSGKFRDLLTTIVKEYSSLTQEDKELVQKAFYNNTDIELYKNKAIELVKYKELPEVISDVFREFFDYLWKDFPLVKEGEERFGSVGSHYNTITKNIRICPFCGLVSIIPPKSPKREDYDHIIPKATYPFISVDFNFVVPACKYCNQVEKTTTDIAYDDDNQRRLFYNPYDENVNMDNLSVKITPHEDYNIVDHGSLLNSINWDYCIKRNNEEQEELNTWNNVYRIKGRYKELSQSHEKEWFDEIIRFYRRAKRDKVDFSIFKRDSLDETKYQTNISSLGVIKHSYFNYILSMKNIEERLNEAIGIQA